MSSKGSALAVLAEVIGKGVFVNMKNATVQRKNSFIQLHAVHQLILSLALSCS